MHSKRISFSILFSAVLIALFEPKPVFAQENYNNAQYSTCSNERFNCGTIAKNLSYPFWGSSNRPKYCGSPEFELDCHGNENLTTTLDSIRYRVLIIDESKSSLTIAYDDFSANLCPNDPKNATSNPGSFRYSSDTQNLTLFYKCQTIPSMPIPTSIRFNCSDETVSVNFYATEAMRNSADRTNFVVPQICEKSVDVRISNSAAQRLSEATISGGSGDLRREIDSGFEVEWTASNGRCEDCVASGGVCGSNNQTEAFACYCRDRPYGSICGSDSATDGNGDKGRLSTAAGLSIAGACILGMFIGVLTYYFIQRKKRRAAMAKSVSLSTPPSSKSKNIPSTNFSRTTQSVSSYDTFSRSDIEKGSTYFGAQIFSYAELEEATDNFDPSRELGEGGFGTVYYGELRDGRAVAVKRLYENNFKRVEQFMNEIEILTQLQHPNLVKLYGCTTRRSRELLLVYEFVSNGTVADHLHGGRRQSAAAGLGWPVRLSIAIETAEALAHLHRKDIIHRDVKTNNILLDAKFRVKVADFGLSKLFPTDVTHVSTAPQGTPGYVDPEYYQCYQLTTKSDVYSFGVVLVELISSLQAVDTNRHRHDINLANMAVSKVQSHAVSELVDPALWLDEGVREMATDTAELAFRCLQQERDMRPSMEEVLAALRAVRSRGYAPQEEPEVVDIRSDDVGLLRHLPPPLSPDSGEADKWPANTATAPYNSY